MSARDEQAELIRQLTEALWGLLPLAASYSRDVIGGSSPRGMFADRLEAAERALDAAGEPLEHGDYRREPGARA